MKYTRYRFKTRSVDDPRPLKPLKPLNVPFWISGYEQDPDFTLKSAIIVCYLPHGTDLHEFWDDAYDVASCDCDEIAYSTRFPKPDWLP